MFIFTRSIQNYKGNTDFLETQTLPQQYGAWDPVNCCSKVPTPAISPCSSRIAAIRRSSSAFRTPSFCSLERCLSISPPGRGTRLRAVALSKDPLTSKFPTLQPLNQSFPCTLPIFSECSVATRAGSCCNENPIFAQQIASLSVPAERLWSWGIGNEK